jgi:uncharacterized protein with GYD domain
MVQDNEYSKHAVLAKLEREVQNPQKLASMWGDIENECEELDVTVEKSYAALGEYDFLLLLDAPSRDRMLEASLVLTRYGLDVQTMGIIETEKFADIVMDS